MSDALQEELRVHFRESTVERVREMMELLDALERDREDAASLRKLARHFHALAGLGTTYGYPRITELGEEGEGSMEASMEASSDAALARWRALVVAVESVLKERPPCGPPDAF
ncbi:MAG TPA: Hpt domain-containing protein [Thermoanaerobaculia bacterium]|jgi:chemotaxis protein histidine kinase CheA|nr:Hpt domain-containing protein [Thermoanaerobaculia bacterium]